MFTIYTFVVGGRQTLPSNLQALFRPIVMQQPEPKDIARVILFVEGFDNAETIGSRLVELFNMSKKMLSPQCHYEWGLRELKTVLLACGRLLKQLQPPPPQSAAQAEANAVNGNDEQQQQQQPQRDKDFEMRLAVNALRMNTMSKLTANDCRRFDMLIGYVFANTAIDKMQLNALQPFIEQAFEQLSLQSNEKQVEKCLQLYEQLEKRMGVVVLGPPNCGKTTIISLLKQAITNTGKVIKSYTISPKSMNRMQLLGHLDGDTRQWNDGTLTSAAIAVSGENSGIFFAFSLSLFLSPSLSVFEPPILFTILFGLVWFGLRFCDAYTHYTDVHSWIICDGEIDPDWIEVCKIKWKQKQTC